MNLDAMAVSVSWALLHTVWQGTLVALVLGVALGTLREATARARYAAACVALLIVALLPLLNIAGASFHVAGRESLPAPPSTILTGPASAIRSDTPAPISVPPAPTSLAARARAAFESSSTTLVLLWLGGALALSLRQLADWQRVRGLARREVRPLTGAAGATVTRLITRLALPRRLRVLQTARLDVPALIGWLRPVVLLPASAVIGLSPRQLEALIAHELAHVRRHDYLVNLLQVAVETLLFYHPAVWWISRRIRIEREHCCDDDAVSICGDRVLYARALATLEGLRTTPPRPALAADGGVLVDRIRRLVRPDAGRRRRWSGPWFAAALASLVLGLAFLPMLSVGQPRAEKRSVDPAAPARTASRTTDSQPEKVDAEVADDPQAVEGRWKVRFRGDDVELTFETGSFWNRHDLQMTLPRSQLSPGRDGYRLRYDAGTFVLLGMSDRGGSRSGTLRFLPSPDYRRAMDRLGYDLPSAWQQLRLAIHDIDIAMLEELKQANGEAPSLDGVLQLAVHGIDAEYVRGMRRSGLDRLELDEIIDLRVHGIDPGYVRDVVASGYDGLEADDIVRLRVHGIPADFIERIVEAGYGEGPIDRMIQLRTHGISPEYITRLHESGFEALTIDDLIKLHTHGIPPEYLEGLQGSGFGTLTLDEVVALHTRGISPEYMKALQDSGFGTLTLDGVVALRTHGISPEYVRGMVEAGFDGISRDELVRLHTHGIEPRYAGDLRGLGYGQRTIEDLVSLKIGGVDADYVRGFHRAGMTDLPVDDVLRLRTHGVNGDYAAEMTDAGVRFDSVEELIRMHNHGVSRRTVRRAAEAGVDLTVDPLVRFQIRGGRSD